MIHTASNQQDFPVVDNSWKIPEILSMAVAANLWELPVINKNDLRKVVAKRTSPEFTLTREYERKEHIQVPHDPFMQYLYRNGKNLQRRPSRPPFLNYASCDLDHNLSISSFDGGFVTMLTKK